ncbi:hypothetical protein BFP77_11790 [Maribacter sp. 4U21]|uniref:hypothetical protein n=1 Tax=Maribacter sp. 4U21 TaxID=1889779 RepID=UPI000C160813|nr:hypothetical protein [Maribacter sp. 4U21]PIB27563.1 hypothetical protein BFP77_11790 [Maribacter sp. 4U21]
MKRNMSLILLVVSAALSCDKGDTENSVVLQNGTYEGTFTVVYDDTTTFSNPVTVIIDGKEFSSSAGPNRFPAGGNGEYEITGNIIEFNDANIWTADFDWGLILSGNYQIRETVDYIEFLKQQNAGEGFYRYRLKKK